jgi:predicted nucleotidyltransferase
MTVKKLLQSLHEYKVKFLIIGAWALPAYGISRNTADIDIFIKPTKINAGRTKKALRSVGYLVVDDAPVELFLQKKLLIRQYALQTDIHPFVAGVKSFDLIWKRKNATEIEGIEVFVPCLSDLIDMKAAAGRAKDKIDLQALRKIQSKEIRK